MRMRIGKRGSILIIVMIFVLVTAITSIGLYNAVYNVNKIEGISEVHKVQSYYAAMAGLRYAAVLLKDPELILGAGNVPVGKNSSGTIFTTNSTLANQLGLTAARDVAISITLRSDGQYDVTATANW